MSWRYRVLDAPPKGVGAYTPPPTTNPLASSWGLVHVQGSPGTMPIDAPAPERDYLPNLTRNGGKDSAQGSMVSPDVIFPSVYVASATNMGPMADAGLGLAERRRNPVPVPSYRYDRLPVVALNAPRIGGRSTMVWPRAFQRFPAATVPGTG